MSAPGAAATAPGPDQEDQLQAKVESTTITTTAACDTARHAMCKGVVFTLTSVDLLDCTCTCHDDEPAEEEDGGLDAWADLLLERDLEDAHFAEGWS